MRHRLSLNAPLVPIAVCLIAGIVAGHYLSTDSVYPLVALPVMLVVAILLRRWPRWQTAGIYLVTALVGYLLSARDIHWPEPQALQQTREYMLQVREGLTEQYLTAGLEGESYAIVSAMTLGDKTALTRDIRDTYSVTGASHVLALSGLHLGIIYWFITLLITGRRWRIVSQIVTILAIWAFTFLTGLAPSTMRAATMLTVYALLQIGHRERASINVLAFTAIVMLLIQPKAVFDIGFQLSYMAVASILLFYPLINGLIPKPFQQEHTIVRWLWGMVGVSLAAQLGVAPLIAFYFHRFSTWFLLTNNIVIPGAYLILIGALVLLVTGSPWVAGLLAAGVTLMNQWLGTIASWPLASIEGLYPSVLQVVLVYVVIACLYVMAKVMIKEEPY